MTPFLLLLPILFVAAVFDLRHYRIPNLLVLLALALFLATAVIPGSDEVAARLLQGAVTFAICFILFGLRLMGGGDAKLLPVVLLFVPAGDVATYLFCLSFGLALGIGGLTLLRRWDAVPAAGWAAFERREGFPVGLAIAISAAAFAAVQSWTP
ncbi:prepilin peptidase [Palleronia sp. KMU-117]|uniref:prepilin peptidase n=1 Tax=Palleronia sp. KMU-117 TaxID=3434108 RepID=UPI003D743E6A